MYSTCIFCHSNLGANESVEHFPVGRRLAFDEARGRLWVVCRKCERWNLSPLDERWEAIEECEKLFRGTRARVSTDNIGLARIHDGFELVRIGSPMRPEMAAWRYGDQFGRRRKKHLLWTGAAVTSVVGLVVLGPVTGLIAGGGGLSLANLANSMSSLYRSHRVRVRVVLPDQSRPVRLKLEHLHQTALVSEGDSWALRIHFESGTRRMPKSDAMTVRGDDALRVASQLLPALNYAGAKRADVEGAVRLISEVADPFALFVRSADPPRRAWSRERERYVALDSGGRLFHKLPRQTQLALEMASHEENERRALEGELALLEDAWRAAEEIAAISDDMFISEDTRERLAELKRGEQERST